MTTQETLIHRTAQETGFSTAQVERVTRSLSSYVAHLMELGANPDTPLADKYQAFRWPHVGVWRCKEKRLERLGLEQPFIKPTKFMADKLQGNGQLD